MSVNPRAALLCLILAILPSLVNAAEDEHPAFGTLHSTQLGVITEVPDVQKLEDKAVDILRTKYGLTLDEARATVRIGGKTDVARCLEFVIINALNGIAQADVISTTVSIPHPTDI